MAIGGKTGEEEKEQSQTSQSEGQTGESSSSTVQSPFEDPSPSDEHEEKDTFGEITSGTVAIPEGQAFGSNPNSGFLITVLYFFKPMFDRLIPDCPEVETCFNALKNGCETLEKFYESSNGIWNMTWEEIKREIDNGKDIVVNAVRCPHHTVLETLFPVWLTTYKHMKESLLDLEDLHKYIVTPIEGLEPVYRIDAQLRESETIRSLCWKLNVNLAQRLVYNAELFFQNTIDFCRSEKRAIRFSPEVGILAEAE